jgi:hypothetical protein
MDPMLSIFRDHPYVLVIAIIGGCMVVNTLIRSIASAVTSGARERSRREIAAYIAEGTISAEQGERLLRADVNGRKSTEA